MVASARCLWEEVACISERALFQGACQKMWFLPPASEGRCAAEEQHQPPWHYKILSTILKSCEDLVLLRAAPQRRIQEYWWIRGWTWASIVNLAQKLKCTLGCIKRSRGVISPLKRFPPGLLCPALGPSAQAGTDVLQQVQSRATKIIRGLEHPLLWMQSERVGVVQPEKALGRPYRTF